MEKFVGERKQCVCEERKQHRLMLNTKIAERVETLEIKYILSHLSRSEEEKVGKGEREKGIKLYFYQTLFFHSLFLFSLFILHTHTPSPLVSQNLSRTIYLTFLLSSGAQARSNSSFCNNIHLFSLSLALACIVKREGGGQKPPIISHSNECVCVWREMRKTHT